MPRPQRPRRICRAPGWSRFSPDGRADGDSVVLLLDEFEALRLMDYEGKTHAECARQMDISRTTVTEIYESARRKLAACLVEGKHLVIAGGEACRPNPCTADTARTDAPISIEKEQTVMRIAVPYENGEIFQHFGRSSQFKLYDIQDNRVVSSAIVDTMGRGHGALASILHAYAVDALLCGGIGPGAQLAMQEAGIALTAGASGDADAAVQAYLSGTLRQNPEACCHHHDTHEGPHHCGDHGCAESDCGTKCP